MYRTVDCGTWGDPWFEELKPPAKLLFLYIITNSRANMCGAYPITLRTMANETGIEGGTVSRLLDTLCIPYFDSQKVYWWAEHSVIFVKNLYRYQRVNSSWKYRVGAAKEAALLPDAVREIVYAIYPDLTSTEPPVSYPTDRVSTNQIKSNQINVIPKTGGNAPAARATRLPDPFVVDESMDEWAFDRGMSDEFVAKHTEAFVLTFRANGNTMKNWRARWQKWMLDAQENGGQYKKRA